MNSKDVNLQACFQGEKDAWDAFVHRYAGVIFAAVQRVMSSSAFGDPEIHDTVQDVFIRLIRDDYRTLRTYDPEKASLVTWLTLVSRSVAIDRLRLKRLPIVSIDGGVASNVATPVSHSTDTPEIPLHVLSARQRLVLRLLFDESRSVAEAARILDVDEQTIRSTKHKALTRLRDHVALNDENPRIEGISAPSPAVERELP